MPPTLGIIITVSVLIAAGLAAYESPEVRKWVDKSRRKIQMVIQSLGEDFNPRVKQTNRHDSSMDEDKSDEAEARRRQARTEILERGRILEGKKRKQRASKADSGVGSFETLVDKDGNLITKDRDLEDITAGATTSVEQPAATESLTRRNLEHMNQSSRLHESVDSPIQLRQLQTPAADAMEPSIASRYEDEVRRTWNLPLPPITTAASQTSHASESLIDMTPTSEFPDPDFSIPDAATSSMHASQPQQSQSQSHESEYFSISPSASFRDPASSFSKSRTISPSPANLPVSHHPPQPSQQRQRPISPIALSTHSATPSIASVTSSISHIQHSELASEHGSLISGFDDNGDESENEIGDGIRTPGSQWTDVSSVVSGEGGQGH